MDYSCVFFCLWRRCVNRSLVRDGKVICQDTDSLHPDSPDYPQQRGCARGRSLRHAIFSKDRLKYPLKRKHWRVGGGDKELRGCDEWERISWDEALDIVASEVTRIKNKYGNKAILATGYEYRNVIPGSIPLLRLMPMVVVRLPGGKHLRVPFRSWRIR